jgi:hypothetical protein
MDVSEPEVFFARFRCARRVFFRLRQRATRIADGYALTVDLGLTGGLAAGLAISQRKTPIHGPEDHCF